MEHLENDLDLPIMLDCFEAKMIKLILFYLRIFLKNPSKEFFDRNQTHLPKK